MTNKKNKKTTKAVKAPQKKKPGALRRAGSAEDLLSQIAKSNVGTAVAPGTQGLAMAKEVELALNALIGTTLPIPLAAAVADTFKKWEGEQAAKAEGRAFADLGEAVNAAGRAIYAEECSIEVSSEEVVAAILDLGVKADAAREMLEARPQSIQNGNYYQDSDSEAPSIASARTQAVHEVRVVLAATSLGRGDPPAVRTLHDHRELGLRAAESSQNLTVGFDRVLATVISEVSFAAKLIFKVKRFFGLLPQFRTSRLQDLVEKLGGPTLDRVGEFQVFNVDAHGRPCKQMLSPSCCALTGLFPIGDDIEELVRFYRFARKYLVRA